MKALVLGASGFVGRRVLARLGPEQGLGSFASRPFPGGVAFDAAHQRLTDLATHLPPDLTHVFILHGVINPELCARDWEGTAAVNVDGVIQLAQDCFERGLTPVFFSTDYVFPGDRGFWTETDPTGPLTAYGRQKAMVEAWLQTQSDPWLAVRLSKVVSDQMEPQNILAEWVRNIRRGETMRCAHDQVLSPLSAEDAAGAAVRLAETGATGLFNVAGPEAFTRLALLRLLAAHVVAADPAARPLITPCRLSDLPFSETRPLDTSLSIEKLQRAAAWRFTPMAQLCANLAASSARSPDET
jgi:dTDP-4-dehydrorhamnose reductase